MKIDVHASQAVVARALTEDLPWGDLTTDVLVSPDQLSTGRLVAREAGVLAGIEVAVQTFGLVDRRVRVEAALRDGAEVRVGTVLATVEGPTTSLLRAERVALNFLQRLSGIASITARYVTEVQGTGAKIADTRKTTPGLRLFEKYAVRVGGGSNHRYCLSDGVLIKDNHLAALRARGIGLRQAVAMARERVPHTVRVEVEVETVADVEEALAGGADAILLDNMTPDELRRAVQIVGGRAITEASGGINLATVRVVAEAGVDLISVGALTHSVKALDISLEFDG